LHTYVDTWAHQQFIGIVSDFNKLKDIDIHPDPAYAQHHIFGELTSGAMWAQSFIANHLPVGHAGALTCPDMPFLKWSFVRENGERVDRDNPTDFLTAATAMFNMARRYLAKDFSLPAIDLSAQDKAIIDRLLRTTLSIDGESRHQVWLKAIKDGQFSFGAETAQYVEQGPGSWKHAALGFDPDVESGDELFEYTEHFIGSDWKKFHDALQYHRLFILHDLLPSVGLCAS
jgi:hypothetical protein